MSSPYYFEEPPGEVPAPPVWLWYRVYAAAMCVMYLLVGAGCIGVYFVAPSSPDRIVIIVMAVISLPFALLFGAALALPKKPWAYWVHLALMGLGMTSACCMLASGPLLWYWLKPEAKAMFGVR